MLLADLDPADSDLLVLPGGELWDAGRRRGVRRRGRGGSSTPASRWRRSAARRRASPAPGCSTTRRHTSAAPEYLAATGYAGGDHYVDERAVVDGDLITAGPQSPVQFARAALGRLGLASERTLDAYEAVFHRGDPAAFPVLMQAAA